MPPFRGLGGRLPTPCRSANSTRKRPTKDPLHVANAAAVLRARVLRGESFPAAALAVAVEFNVSYEALVAAF